MKARSIHLRLMLFPLICVLAIPARAQTSNADFQQAVAAYQQSPSADGAEKVIRMTAAIDQLPPISEEARRHFVRGTTLFKDAKSPDDYKQVIDEFRQAVHLAPWWPEARYNFALAWEMTGDFAYAIEELNLYRLFKVSESDARSAQDKVYALEARYEALGKRIDGRRYIRPRNDGFEGRWVRDVRGETLIEGLINSPGNEYMEYGRFRFLGPKHTWRQSGLHGDEMDSYVISKDGESITLRRHWNDGQTSDEIYKWQR